MASFKNRHNSLSSHPGSEYLLRTNTEKENSEQYHTFSGLPLPDINVIQSVGLAEISKIDNLIKEIIEYRKAVYGCLSNKVPFRTNILEFVHKSKPQNKFTCLSGTIIEHQQLANDRFSDFSLKGRINSLDNYLVFFTNEAMDVIKKLQK
ncbi:MAG: hypothetical protein K9M51_03825 [Candidatus Gracilibacteria bacterium]|nr:hypothetical protein [Candidatus Gracilibacteria bacterium]